MEWDGGLRVGMVDGGIQVWEMVDGLDREGEGRGWWERSVGVCGWLCSGISTVALNRRE